jgi:hypothetical protein
MQTLNATDVRKEFSRFIDTVVREKPVVFKRNRDHIISMSVDQAAALLSGLRFRMQVFPEKDGTTTATLKGFDLVVNEKDMETAKQALAKELIDYSQDYFNQFNLYYNSPNRREHFPYILKVALTEDCTEVEEMIDA